MSLIGAIRKTGRRLLKQAGYDLVRTKDNPSPAAQRVRLLREQGIDLVFDVGANIGQYGWELRQNGYTGRIVSFEPLAGPYRELAGLAAARPPWVAVNAGLGDRAGKATIHVANNSESSSLLPMLPRHGQADASIQYVAEEQIQVVTLPDIWPDYWTPGARSYLKIDAQGYEQRILKAAMPVLEQVHGLQLELSLVPLYEGESLFGEMVEQMRSMGYVLVTLEPMFTDRHTRELLQVDAIFFRPPPRPPH